MTAASPTYSLSGVFSLVRYLSNTSKLGTSIAIGFLVLALIFHILGKGLISDYRPLLASWGSASTNRIVTAFDTVTKVCYFLLLSLTWYCFIEG